MSNIRKSKTKEPCGGCGLSPSRCICSHIPKLNLKTQLLLIIHAKELKRTSNSGSLAVEALTNSQMKVRGEKAVELDLSSTLSDEYHNLLLYPSEDAVELNSAFMASLPTKPIRLIVPDGNWRQASKVPSRHKELASVQRVIIKHLNQATYHLRKETSPYGMSTLEAIARAMGVIESAAVESELMKLYQLKLEKTLEGRKGRMASALKDN